MLGFEPRPECLQGKQFSDCFISPVLGTVPSKLVFLLKQPLRMSPCTQQFPGLLRVKWEVRASRNAGG